MGGKRAYRECCPVAVKDKETVSMVGQNSGTIRTGLFGQLILAMASVGATLVMFSPHLWLMRHEVPEAFQWHRALTFLAQCAEPFRSDVDKIDVISPLPIEIFRLFRTQQHSISSFFYTWIVSPAGIS